MENNTIEEVNQEYTKDDIVEMICQHNDKYVIFDFCLAKIFSYSLKAINQTLKRNEDKVNNRDIYKITQDDLKKVINESKIFEADSVTETDFSVTETHLQTTYGIKLNKRYIPTVFTKEGVKFLASLLKKETVKHYLPIILQAFEEVETDNQIVLKIAENPIKSSIYDKIYTIRGEQVMLDFDLAELYGYDVKRLNEQVKRNIERFPEDFMFQLSNKEIENLWSQFATANINSMSRSLPYAFTEQGVYMLSTVLKNEIATQQSIAIMRAFKRMKHYIAEHKQLISVNDMKQLMVHNQRIGNLEEQFETINNKLDITIQRNEIVEENLDKLMNLFKDNELPKEFTFFNNQLFEADVVYKEIYSQANHSIYLIDNYISIKTLSHLKCKKENVDVIIFSDNLGRNDKLQQVEIDDFNKEYPSLVLKPNKISHDRYIIIDYNTNNEKIYHSGASIKDAGKKLCSITQILDTYIFHQTIERLLLQKQ